MDSLSFPKIEIKISPSKQDSGTKRLGFRGVFKYCYLNQDDVGSKGFLDQGNWGKAASTKETFKYIFNVLDSNIADCESIISEKTNSATRIKQKYDSVSEFLRDTDCETLENIDDLIDGVEENLQLLNEELKEISISMTSDSESYKEIKSIFSEFQLNEKKVLLDISKTQEKIDSYSRLNNDYENDIKKLKVQF